MEFAVYLDLKSSGTPDKKLCIDFPEKRKLLKVAGRPWLLVLVPPHTWSPSTPSPAVYKDRNTSSLTLWYFSLPQTLHRLRHLLTLFCRSRSATLSPGPPALQHSAPSLDTGSPFNTRLHTLCLIVSLAVCYSPCFFYSVACCVLHTESYIPVKPHNPWLSSRMLPHWWWLRPQMSDEKTGKWCEHLWVECAFPVCVDVRVHVMKMLSSAGDKASCIERNDKVSRTLTCISNQARLNIIMGSNNVIVFLFNEFYRLKCAMLMLMFCSDDWK